MTGMKKTQYRIRNWPTYSNTLIEGGSLTLWVEEEAIWSWHYIGPTQRGAQYRYADAAIKGGLTLNIVAGHAAWEITPQRNTIEPVVPVCRHHRHEPRQLRHLMPLRLGILTQQ